MELRKRYIQLKQKAKMAMINGQVRTYLRLLTQMEELNLIMIRVRG